MIKNEAGQKWTVFAFDRVTLIPKAGDAANISAKIQLNDGTRTAVAAATPVEQEDGYYLFTLSQAETNGDKAMIYPESTTENIQVIGCPAVVYPRLLQTGDSFSRIGATGSGLTSLAQAAVCSEARLAELGSANLPADLDTLISRLTALRAGYLDKLNVSGTIAHSDSAYTYKATVSNLATSAELAAHDSDIDAQFTSIKGSTFDPATDSLEAISNGGGSGDPWATTLPGGYGAGTAGKIIGDNINAPIDVVDTVVDAIKAVTDNLPNSGSLTDLALASVCTETRLSELDAVTAGKMANQVDIIQTGTSTDIPGTITTLDTLIRDIPTVSEFNARTLLSADYTIVSDLGTVQTADHTAAIADIPTVEEFNARTLLSADYTIVSDLGTVQTADHAAAIADLPTVSEFNDRTLPSADYTVVSDLGTVQTADHTAAISAIIGYLDTEISTILENTGTTIPGLISGLNNISAADVWSAVTRTLTANTNLNDLTVADIIAGISDGTYDLQEMLRIMFAVLAGHGLGGGTSTATYKDPTNTKSRIVATLDINGNRTPISYDGS